MDLNKKGRPRKETEHIKKRLFFSDNTDQLLNINKYNIARYRQRQKNKKSISKPQLQKQYWQPHIIKFVEANAKNHAKLLLNDIF